MTIRLHGSFAIHPGVWMHEEVVTPRGLTVTALAQALGVTRPALSAVLNGRAAVSAEMAIRFEKAFGIRAETLARMQSAHDLARARQDEKRIKVQPLGPEDATPATPLSLTDPPL